MLYFHMFGNINLRVKSLFKLMAGLLVFLFILSPLAPVFADEPDPPPDPVLQDSSSLPPIMSQENSNTSFRSTKKISPETDLSTGSLTYAYPITIPQGRASMTPDISLIYNSQNTDQQNIIGYGWTTSIPYITRINKTGVEKLYTDNYFSSSLDGELVTGNDTDYIAKVENGSFLDYSYSNGYWIVTDKQGTVYTFGQNAGARQNSSDGSKVYKWMLEKVLDTNNNSIAYTYSKDQGQIYPETISYTNNGSTAGIYSVEFSKTLRDDALISYVSGFSVKTRYVLTTITIKTNDTWNRKYDLTYTTGDNGQKSVLESITESGKDESNNVTTLPPTEFLYQQSSSTPGWELNTGWTFPTHLVNNNSNWLDPLDFVDHRMDAGVRMFDANIDGLVDFVQSGDWSNQGTSKGISLNNGNSSGWTLDSNWTISPKFTDFNSANQPWDAGLRVADVNGDGLPDLVRGMNSTNQVYMHTGLGWTLDTNWVPPTSFIVGSFQDNGVRMGDVNGDGLPDIVESREATSGSSEVTKVYINDGDNTGWTYDSNWEFPVCNQNTNLPKKPYFIDFYGHDAGTILMDINGDGLLDLIQDGQPNGSWARGVSLNKGDGTGWVCNTSWNSPGGRAARFGDVNGDGFLDAMDAYIETSGSTRNTRLNTGLETVVWSNNTAWSIPTDFVAQDGSDYGTRLEDVNGDGMPDLIQAIDNNGVNIHKVYINNNKPSDLLISISEPSGATNIITYKASAQYTNSGSLLNPQLPIIVQTVSSITIADSVTNYSDTTTYSYQGGLYFFGNSFNKKFSGFNKVTVTDSDNNTTTMFYHQGDSSDTSHGEYNDDEWKIGRPYRVEVKDSSGNLFSKTINKWDEYSLGNSSKFVKLVQTVDSTYDGNTTHKDKAVTYTYSDTTGNKTTETSWGQVTGSDDGTFSDTGSDKFTSTLTYASGGNIVGLPSKETVTNQSSDMVKETKYYYDSQSWGNVTVGNQTKREDWKQVGDPYISNQKSYNLYGLVTSETDARGKVTSYSYDTYNLYPTTVTNPLSQATSLTYDYSSGAVKQTTDPNGNVFTTVYDGLDRPIEEKIPDVNGSGQVAKTTYEYTDTANALRTKTRSYLDASNIVDSYTYFDGLKRKIQERTEAATSTQFSVRDFVYSHDKLQKESLPYFSNNSARTTATTDTDLYTNYTYDTLDRVTTATTTVGTTTNSYNDWKVTVTDPTSQVKDLYRDAYDNLIQVDEHKDTSTYTTSYEFNVLKKLTKLTDALGNIRNFTYDGVGNILSGQDLHASADTTFGTWSYTYDDAGNLTSRTDPNSQTVNFTYDDINRVLTENYTGQTGTEVTYEYDTCTEGIGRLCETSNAAITTEYDYNELGQLTSELRDIDTEEFTTAYTYDRQGNQLIITNPDDSEVKYLYDAGGTVSAIQHKEDTDTSFSNIITSITYNPVGLMETVNYGNGSSTTNTYDADELYRLREKITSANTETVQDLTYTYDSVGNITQIVDESETDTAKTTDYSYDDLHRLSVAEITEAENEELDGPNQEQATQGFEYNAIGNIITNPDRGSYDYDGNQGSNYANPHAVTTTSDGRVYTYDHNGNLVNDDLLAYTWDYNNRLIEIQGEPGTFYYSYDVSGQRIKAETPNDTLYYPTKFYTATGDGVEKHIFLGDTAIASVKGSNSTADIYTIHSDHLTGSNVLTDESEDVSQLTDYYAFGTLRLDDQIGDYNEKRKYTGHEYDQDTGLTYMNARYYDASLGRFLGQDSVFHLITDPGRVEEKAGVNYDELLSDPQMLNSYSYVTNNPLKYVDITGNARNSPIAAFGSYMAQGQRDIGNFMTNVASSSSQAGGVMGHSSAFVYNSAASISYDTANVFDPQSSGGDKAKSLVMLGVTAASGGEGKIVAGAAKSTVWTARTLTGAEAVAQQAKMLKGIENPTAINIMKDVFRTTDSIPGGTMGAIRNEILTGNPTKGIFHLNKAENTINRIKNAFDAVRFSSTEASRLKGVSNSLKSLIKNFNH